MIRQYFDVTFSYLFLLVTDPSARIIRKGWEGRTPRTAAEFAETFLQSPVAKDNRKEMEAYEVEFVKPQERRRQYQQSAVAEHAKTQRKRSAYTVSIPMQARAVMLRRIQILRGNRAAEVVKAVAFVIQAIISGTVYFRLPQSTVAYFSRGGVLFL
jgi:ATP-binding cassette, subfamily G (WHITE), member 2, SNQ2